MKADCDEGQTLRCLDAISLSHSQEAVECVPHAAVFSLAGGCGGGRGGRRRSVALSRRAGRTHHGITTKCLTGRT